MRWKEQIRGLIRQGLRVPYRKLRAKKGSIIHFLATPGAKLLAKSMKMFYNVDQILCFVWRRFGWDSEELEISEPHKKIKLLVL